MTVLEATNELYMWFAKNDSFCIDQDFIKIIPITEHPKRDRAAFLSALQEFEKWELVSSSKIEEDKYWVLKKPYSSAPQTIDISADTALGVADTLNKFCDLIKDDTNRCDSTKVDEGDIKNLIYIASLSFSKKDVDFEDELL